MNALILLSILLSAALGIARGADLAFGTDAVTGLCTVGSVWWRYAALGAVVLAAVLIGRHCAGKAETVRSRQPLAGVLAFAGAVCFLAAAGAAGILLQFPFYAGIMGMMVAANDQGVSLAGVISQFFVSISTNVTFPMLSFLAAGIVNFFVPSGGGQWAVQGPIMMPAGMEMGIENGRTAMAIAWGDQWTNMIQPFWALPALGVAKLSARDIMGYLVIVLLFTGLVAILGFLAWGLFFA